MPNKPAQKKKHHPGQRKSPPRVAPKVHAIQELKGKRGFISVKKAIEEAEDEVARIDRERQVKLKKIGDRFEQKFEDLMRISPEDAWDKIVTKIEKGTDEEEVNIFDILTPILNRIIFERTRDANMPATFNLFARYPTRGDPAKGEPPYMTRWQWYPKKQIQATVFRLREVQGEKKIVQAVEDVPAIIIYGMPYPEFSTDPIWTSLRAKDKRPLVKQIEFILMPQNILELYEAVEAYV